MTYWMDDIENIKLPDGTVITPIQAPKSTADDNGILPNDTEQIPLLPAEEGTMEPVAGSGEDEPYGVSNVTGPERFTQDILATIQNNPEAISDKTAFAVLGIALGFVIFIILVYAYFAFCFQKIAFKVGVDNGWFA